MYMIVDHIHHYTDAILMKCLYHLFHFSDTHFTMVWICRIRAFRYIIVHRVITPVKLWHRKVCFINRAIVKRRKQMQMCNTQFFDII